jgi:hypothetical protein
MRRAFGYDLLNCPSCGGKMVLLACIMQRAVITKILSHIGLPTEPPRPAKARVHRCRKRTSITLLEALGRLE